MVSLTQFSNFDNFHTLLEITSTGSVQSWPKGYFFVVFEISAAELFNTCCRDSADLILPCCRGAAESPTDAMFYSTADLQ